MQVLVLGGSGFLGRHVVAALLDRGHAPVIGTRDPRRLPSSDRATIAFERRRVRFERMGASASWDATLAGIDAVVNCVGILRPRGRATYDCVHRRAPLALAGAASARTCLVRALRQSLLRPAPPDAVFVRTPGVAAPRQSTASQPLTRAARPLPHTRRAAPVLIGRANTATARLRPQITRVAWAASVLSPSPLRSPLPNLRP